MALKAIMDRFQPEVHADIHGLSMNFEKYIMGENSGSAYSNLASRSYHREVIRLMDEAGKAEGFPQDLQESDAERIFWGPELEVMKEKTWSGRPRIYASVYSYFHYHTLLSASEISWERSGLIRHRRLLQIGNETWPSEYYPGYPTRVALTSGYHMVTAYGQTAAARRRSRVELWNLQKQIVQGSADPFVEGKFLYICAATRKTADAWLEDVELRKFAEKIVNCPNMNGAPITKFLTGWPVGQNHPEAFLSLRKTAEREESDRPIEHGLALRMRIFFDKAKITELTVNGYPIERSETDGYIQWIANGFTYVQVNIPPEKTKTEELFVVCCRYDPGEKRGHWEGWKAYAR